MNKRRKRPRVVRFEITDGQEEGGLGQGARFFVGQLGQLLLEAADDVTVRLVADVFQGFALAGALLRLDGHGNVVQLHVQTASIVCVRVGRLSSLLDDFPRRGRRRRRGRTAAGC